jgi:FlaA1/EpsC-like NDP-sugar epimerase
MAELYLLERARELSPEATRLMAVRFGNVLGSRGSVVPLFQRQIARGGPVTVSHPEVARYFMTLHEAALLVVEAGALGTGGEIFILDMGEQVLITELAKDLIIFSGFRPDVDIPITYVGLRQGEKLREELVHDFEPLSDTEVRGLRFTRGVPSGRPLLQGPAMIRIRELIQKGDAGEIIREIERLVPEAALSRSLVPGYPRR